MSSYRKFITLIELFEMGKKYQRLCPQELSLSYTLPEVKFNYYYKTFCKYLPFMLFFIVMWTYFLNANLIAMLITTLMLIFIPIFSLIWFGKRALMPISLHHLEWFNLVRTKLFEIDLLDKKQKLTPNYFHFIKMIILSKKHFNDYFPYDKQ